MALPPGTPQTNQWSKLLLPGPAPLGHLRPCPPRTRPRLFFSHSAPEEGPAAAAGAARGRGRGRGRKPRGAPPGDRGGAAAAAAAAAASSGPSTAAHTRQNKSGQQMNIKGPAPLGRPQTNITTHIRPRPCSGLARAPSRSASRWSGRSQSTSRAGRRIASPALQASSVSPKQVMNYF